MLLFGAAVPPSVGVTGRTEARRWRVLTKSERPKVIEWEIGLVRIGLHALHYLLCADFPLTGTGCPLQVRPHGPSRNMISYRREFEAIASCNKPWGRNQLGALVALQFAVRDPSGS